MHAITMARQPFFPWMTKWCRNYYATISTSKFATSTVKRRWSRLFRRLLLDILIKAGANVNAQDNNGETALMQAAENNLVDKVQVLVKAPGILLEQRDNKDETALMKARARHLPESIQALISAGAAE